MKVRDIIVRAVALPVLFSIFACGGKSELSRSKTNKVIQASTKFTPGEYSLQPAGDAALAGVQQGFWKKEQLVGFGSFYALTPKGETYFTNQGGGYLKLKQTMGRRVIEVTGIADGPGVLGPPGTIKDVEFTWDWDWDSLPKDVKVVLVTTKPAPSKGEALLKLYDDGWRLEEIKLD